MTGPDWPALDALHEARRRAGGMAYPLWHALEDAYPAIRAQVRALEDELQAVAAQRDRLRGYSHVRAAEERDESRQREKDALDNGTEIANKLIESRQRVAELERALAASDRALACASQMLAAHLDDVPAVEAVAAFVEMHGVFTEERELTKAVAAAIRAALAAGKEE